MPQGGIEITNNDIGTPKRFRLEFDDAVFVPVIAAITTIVKGTILGRVTASAKLTPFTVAATHGVGSGVPVGVLGTDIISDAVPSDENISYIVAGGVREEELVIDGAAPGAGVTEAIKDQLRDFSIIPLPAQDLSILDNQ